MIRVEKQQVTKESSQFKQIDHLCFLSKNMYNYGNYIIRQKFIETTKEKEEGIRSSAIWIRYNELDKELISTKQPDYFALPNNTSQKVLQQLDKNWKSFFVSIKDWKRNPHKYKGIPKLPKYKDKKNGRNEVIFTANQFRVKNGFIHFPKKAGLDPIKTGIDLMVCKLNQIRLVPCTNSMYKIEIVYDKPNDDKIDHSEGEDNLLGIDIGINNLMTLTSNKVGFTPIIIKGRQLKSVNQYFNKIKSKLQSELALQYPNRHTSNRINKLTIKRNNKVDDYIHKATCIVKQICLDNNISKIVVGLNKQWKTDINIGKQNNQNFVGIPHSRMIEMLVYKLGEIGCEVIVREESYTSQASALDLDFIPTYNSKNEGNFTFSGKRIKRGLYKTKDGILLNADVNGSYNILRKEFGDAVMPTDRGLILNPISIYVDVNKNKH